MSVRNHAVMNFLALVLSVAGFAATSEAVGKIPPEVINQAAADGTVLVLVGLKVPWQMEATLTKETLRAQREAIFSVQSQLLAELAGRKFKVVRRFEQVPGIALEVGADALAELAHSETVTNVVLDRPGAQLDDKASERRASASSAIQDKVPWQLFNRAASNGTVLVLAGLRVPWQREDKLNDNLLALQRDAILGAQKYLLAELAGTHYRVTRLYRQIPGIALRVGPDALKVLEQSPAITNVVPDRPVNLTR